MLLAAGLLLAGGLHASGPVKVTGDVTVPMSEEQRAVTITVLDAAGDTLQLHETWTGRFKLHLPEEEVITLRFSQPGCLAKDVVVDTRHALGEDLSQKDAAEVLGVSEGTVAWRMSEVKKRLRIIARTEDML